MIRAVTFDLWDTLFVDDSDEPRRAAQGLLPKSQAREQTFVDEVLRHHPEVGADRATAAIRQANSTFMRQWKEQHQTPPVEQRLREALGLLGLRGSPGLASLVRAWEDMEVEIPPDLAPNAVEMLAQLSGKYRLGVISDAIVTPGRGLRRILTRYGLLQHFSSFVFSDEAGASKPSPTVFARAAAELDLPPNQILHIGDRESNDVQGPQAFGFKAILYTGVKDRGAAHTRADAVCADHLQLPSLLSRLSETP